MSLYRLPVHIHPYQSTTARPTQAHALACAWTTTHHVRFPTILDWPFPTFYRAKANQHRWRYIPQSVSSSCPPTIFVVDWPIVCPKHGQRCKHVFLPQPGLPVGFLHSRNWWNPRGRFPHHRVPWTGSPQRFRARSTGSWTSTFSRLNRFCALGIEVKKLGFRTPWDITGQKL